MVARKTNQFIIHYLYQQRRKLFSSFSLSAGWLIHEGTIGIIYKDIEFLRVFQQIFIENTFFRRQLDLMKGKFQDQGQLDKVEGVIVSKR